MSTKIIDISKNISESVRAARKAKGLTLKALAVLVSTSAGHLSDIENGKTTPGAELLISLQRALEIDFFDKPTLPPGAKHVRRIPVLGKVPAGFPEYVAEEVIGWVTRSDVPENAYALQIKGDSMLPLESGDYVVFVQDGNYQNGDIVVAHNEWGEFMVKRLRVRPDGSQLLTSDNPKYSPIEPNEYFRIVGKVIKAWRDLI